MTGERRSQVDKTADITRNEILALLWPVVKRMPAYIRLAFSLVREPAIPRNQKALLYAAAVYQISPLHVPVGLVPVLGQIDTPILLLLGLRKALSHCPPEALARHLEHMGLSEPQLEEHLAAAQLAGRWLLLQTARGAGRGVFLTRRAARSLTGRRGRPVMNVDSRLENPLEEGRERTRAPEE